MGFKLFSFKGGIHVPDSKDFTKDKPIEKAKIPSLVYIPLQQHAGAPCEPLVKPGDRVKMGQVIGQQKGFVSAPVHSSVSGKVKSILPLETAEGNKTMTIVIENDGLDTLDDSIETKDIDGLSPQEIKHIILDAGIVGMGGAAFPTHVKLSPPAEKDIDAIILNGVECEPYLTSDYRLMVEHADEIVSGLKIIMKVLDVKTGYIGIEDNKLDAIASMKEAVGIEPDIKVITLKTKYPQGSEKQLIEAITGRRVPSGGLPMDVGVVINNVGTASEIYKAVKTGMPLIERVVTVTGEGIMDPKNLLVRIGTPFSELVEECGGFSGEPSRIIAGGPMMGIAQHSLNIPVTKGVCGILVLSDKETRDEDVMPCIRCAKCVQACPIHLLPLSISAYSLKGDYEACQGFNAMDCIECGSCSYVCPANRPLMQSIKLAKREIVEKKKSSIVNS